MHVVPVDSVNSDGFQILWVLKLQYYETYT